MRPDDRAGFAAFYRQYGDRIYRFCYRLCGSVSDAEDLTQEVFLAAFQGEKRFEGRSSVQTWLYRIALNCWRHSCRTPRFATTPIEDVTQAGPGLEQAVADHLTLTCALAALPPDLREAFLLVKAEGLKYREAAQVLGIPLGTVQWQVHQASRLLAAALPLLAPPAAHRRFPVRRVAVGVASLAAAIAAFFWLIPGQPGRPTIALADVEEAMQQVQTVSWRTEEQAGDKLGNTKFTFTDWLRRDPPALATTNFNTTPSNYLNPMPIKNLLDMRGGFLLSKSKCEIQPVLKVSAKQRVEEQIRSLTQFPQAQSSSSPWSNAQTTSTIFRQSPVILDGQNVMRFDLDFRTEWTMSGGHTTYRIGHSIIWADLKTHRVVRIETHLSEDTIGVKPFQTMIRDHFQYNRMPPKGVFDWSPPPGAVTNFRGRKTIYYVQPMHVKK